MIAGTSVNRTPQYHIYHVNGVVPTTVQVVYDVPVSMPPVKYMTIDPSVLNQLINSKLLTPEEKRSLLEEQGILKRKEVPETPEA